MKYCFLLFLLFCGGCFSVQSYKQLHRRAVVVDFHNDVLTQSVEKGYAFDADLQGKTHSDLARMRQGGVDVQVFSVWCDGSFGKGAAFRRAIREIDSLYAVAARNPSAVTIVKSYSDIEQAVQQHRLAALMGVEGGHMMEDNLDYLDSFKNRGVCYMTLTWNNSTSWATSARDETRDSLLHQPKGLNDFGKRVVKKMNELGMIVDVSHVGEQTFWDVIHTTTKPIIASHSDAYALAPAPRNLRDAQIVAIAKNGGVIGVNFYPGFIDSLFDAREKAFNEKHREERDSLLKINPETFYASEYLAAKYKEEAEVLRPPLSMLIDHIDYLVKLAGIDHVGLGSDLDGISVTPRGIADITDYPLVTKALKKRGYSKEDIRKILGENFLRVYKENSDRY